MLCMTCQAPSRALQYVNFISSNESNHTPAQIAPETQIIFIQLELLYNRSTMKNIQTRATVILWFKSSSQRKDAFQLNQAPTCLRGLTCLRVPTGHRKIYIYRERISNLRAITHPNGLIPVCSVRQDNAGSNMLCVSERERET